MDDVKFFFILDLFQGSATILAQHLSKLTCTLPALLLPRYAPGYLTAKGEGR
jgi:hypothetical protein